MQIRPTHSVLVILSQAVNRLESSFMVYELQRETIFLRKDTLESCLYRYEYDLVVDIRQFFFQLQYRVKT